MTERGRRSFLTAQWRYLVMLNYEVDPSILHALVPRGTELDLWNGRAIASVVGFRFERRAHRPARVQRAVSRCAHAQHGPGHAHRVARARVVRVAHGIALAGGRRD